MTFLPVGDLAQTFIQVTKFSIEKGDREYSLVKYDSEFKEINRRKLTKGEVNFLKKEFGGY